MASSDNKTSAANDKSKDFLSPPGGQAQKSVLLPDGSSSSSSRNDGLYLTEPLYHHAFRARALSMPDLSASLALANFDRATAAEAEAALIESEYGTIPTQDEIRDDIQQINLLKTVEC